METLVVKKPLFGKEVEFIIHDADPLIAEDIVEQAYEEGLRLSKIFNFFDPSSELSILNKKRKLRVSKELLEVIKIALKFSKLSCGEYDISLGKLFLERKKGKSEEKPGCCFRDIKIKGNEVVLANSEVLIDLGSIAKGYITEKMARLLKKAGIIHFIVNGRGDIVVSGKEIVGIKHPREDKIIKYVELENCAIATSGDYSQYCGSFEKSHILNKKEYISVSVIAPNLTLADVYATAFAVSKNRTALLNDKKIKIMAIDKDINIKYFNNFKSFLINL